MFSAVGALSALLGLDDRLLWGSFPAAQRPLQKHRCILMIILHSSVFFFFTFANEMSDHPDRGGRVHSSRSSASRCFTSNFRTIRSQSAPRVKELLLERKHSWVIKMITRRFKVSLDWIQSAFQASETPKIRRW